MDSRILLGRLQPLGTSHLAGGSARPQTSGAEFRNVFNQTLQNVTGTGLNVSSHAEKRMVERNIAMDGKTKDMLMEALDELRAKGAKDSLVVTQDAAYLLNVPTRTLVTAMDLSEANDRIITNIDSVSVKHT